MFDLITNWNNCPMSIRENESIKDVKNIILAKQNEIEVCQKKDCYVCSK